MKVVIASDSFKGSLSSMDVAGAAAQGIADVFPDCEIVKVPVADGGEGSVDSLVSATGGKKISAASYDPLMRSMEASYGVLGDGRTAVIEISAASGLALLDENERNPMATSTYGTGVLISDALGRGYRNFIIALGGSATNDGGIGILSALGARFLDGKGNELYPCGESLSRIRSMDVSGLAKDVSASFCNIAVDVDNVICGENGAAYVFAPQKGADPHMVGLLDSGLDNLCAVLEKETGRHLRELKGGGAAGGACAGLFSVLPSKIARGAELVLEAAGFNSLLEDADFVVTGEGRVDMQTGMGKTPAAVAAAAERRGVPVICMAGQVSDDFHGMGDPSMPCSGHGVPVFCIQSGIVSLEQAMDRDNAFRNVRRTARQIFSVVKEASALRR